MIRIILRVIFTALILTGTVFVSAVLIMTERQLQDESRMADRYGGT